jgi:nicotinamide mononucleotide (NMN) deamidase PncC
MTLKVVHGLVKADYQTNQQQLKVQNHTVRQHGAAAAQCLGSVGANEAALTTIRSSRCTTSFDRIKEPNEAQRVANSVAEQVLNNEELALSSHGAVSSTLAKDHLL